MQLEFHTEVQKASSTQFTELTLHEYLSLSNPRWQISNRNEAVPKISNELIPMSTVIDQPQFAIHVFVREAEPVFFPHIASRRDQTAIRLVFVQNTATIYASPKREVTFFIVSCTQ